MFLWTRRCPPLGSSLYPYWYDQWEKQICDYAQAHALPYLNLLAQADALGIDFSTDTYDGGLHLNLSGAEKATRRLGDVLSSDLGLPDRRGETELAAIWAEKLADYQADIHAQRAALPIPEDTTPPTITGTHDLTVATNGSPVYRDGVTAQDDRDGAVSLRIDSSRVDLTLPGTYPVVYSAADKSGNEATVTVTLTVAELTAETGDGAGSPEAEQSGQITREAVDQLADGILAEIITPGMSQRQKARTTYDYVLHHISFVGTSDKSNWLVGAYTGFTQRRGDCFNYFACSKALLTRAGIPNVDIQRMGGSVRHYWQAVDVGDGYYHFDACPHSVKFPLTSFLLTDAEVAAYSARRGDNYYTYDHESCPVDVVDGDSATGLAPAASPTPAEEASAVAAPPVAAPAEEAPEAGAPVEEPPEAGTPAEEPPAEEVIVVDEAPADGPPEEEAPDPVPAITPEPAEADRPSAEQEERSDAEEYAETVATVSDTAPDPLQ